MKDVDVKKRNAPQRVVVCAAIRYGDVIITGARHHDKIMNDQIRLLKSATDTKLCGEKEQGFVDQFGIFLTREEAFDVATAANQIIRRCGGDNGKLFSENLY